MRRAGASYHMTIKPERAHIGSDAKVTQDRPLKGAWAMTALLFLFMLINFADKVVVGLAAQPIMAELGLKPERAHRE